MSRIRVNKTFLHINAIGFGILALVLDNLASLVYAFIFGVMLGLLRREAKIDEEEE